MHSVQETLKFAVLTSFNAQNSHVLDQRKGFSHIVRTRLSPSTTTFSVALSFVADKTKISQLITAAMSTFNKGKNGKLKSSLKKALRLMSK